MNKGIGYDSIGITCGLAERERVASAFAQRRAQVRQARAGAETPNRQPIITWIGTRLIRLGQRLAPTTTPITPAVRQS